MCAKKPRMYVWTRWYYWWKPFKNICRAIAIYQRQPSINFKKEIVFSNYKLKMIALYLVHWTMSSIALGAT